ncbi:MAG: hypothetical protein EFT35_10310 [Methanophagales archaeon ANME-1-THS]|nr:MAG: hypothetical protein EFT35_10310 [Methanophagales archaeon ANME-1-THS]
MIRKVEEKRFYLGSLRTRYKPMKRIFIQEGGMWVEAAKKALEDLKWYQQEHEHYVTLGERYAKEAERCLLEVQRLDEEFYKCVIEASICVIGAKVCLKGIEYTKRMFPEVKSTKANRRNEEKEFLDR